MLPAPQLEALHAFTLKVAARCNLDCSYCYVYNRADATWRERPALMSDQVLDAAVARIGEYCRAVGRNRVSITFHGGEPCLIGVDTLARWTARIRAQLAPVEVQFVIQTNGTLLDAAWCALFRDQAIEVGVSLDGPPDVNDRVRLDHRRRGSYSRVRAGLDQLRHAGLDFSVLSVMSLGSDPLAIHRHLSSLGANGLSYIMPDVTHDEIDQLRALFGPTPCADYLIPIFDEWWFHQAIDLSIQPFWGIAQMVLGGDCRLDNFGTSPLGFVFIETDGTIEGLDVMRSCEHGLARTPLNVASHGFADFAALDHPQATLIFQGRQTPTGCAACPERDRCAGGYVPHRFRRGHGFDNPSVWCADILALFRHIRTRLEVDVGDTARRHQVLADMAARPVKSEERGHV